MAKEQEKKALVEKDYGEAAKLAEKELLQEKVDRVKTVMKNILQEIQKQKDIKSESEEALRILKLDLEDLRKGKLENIDKRHESKHVRSVSPLDSRKFIKDMNAAWPGDSITFTSIPSGMTISGGSATATYVGDTLVDGSAEKFYSDATSGTYSVMDKDGAWKEYHF